MGSHASTSVLWVSGPRSRCFARGCEQGLHDGGQYSRRRGRSGSDRRHTRVAVGGSQLVVAGPQSDLERPGHPLAGPVQKASSPEARLYHSRVLTRVRYQIETAFSQFVGRIGVRHAWARDTWRLRHRLLRGMLMHTLCILFNQIEGHEPLQFAALVAA